MVASTYFIPSGLFPVGFFVILNLLRLKSIMRWQMDRCDKRILFEKLKKGNLYNERLVYEALEECEALKTNYYDYMITEPINCDQELLRVPTADYELCCALFTMLLREDHFCEGSFGRRVRCGQVTTLIERIIELLS